MSRKFRAVRSTIYIVQPGDTLWLIAQKFNITLDELIAANPQIEDPSNIYLGQEINIPDKTSTPPTPPDQILGRESLTYLYAGNTVSYLKILSNTKDSILTICIDYFDIDPQGNLLITPSNKIDPNFIREVHKGGMKITPFISNHWDRPLGVAALNNRENLSTQIVNVINNYDLDGINIDIENVNEQYRAAYTDFTRLLRSKLPADKIVSVAVAANPYGWNVGWHGSYDYKALADNSDYLMIMAYDESYHGGPAGPVSSASFFDKSIQYALKQGVPKEKIVAGIPFFGRYWKQGDAVGGIGITGKDVQYLIDNYNSVVWYDEANKSANAIVTINDGDPLPQIWGGRILTPGVYNIWYDNTLATKFKLETIDKYDLRGAGSWALGQENTDIWEFYTSVLNGGFVPEPPGPLPGPEPEPPAPEEPEVNPMTNLEKILYILNNSGNTRVVTPSSLLTRGEAAVVIANLLYLTPEPNAPTFADTTNYWGKGEINALKSKGIIEGDSKNQFYPNRNITKEELTVMLYNVLLLPDTIFNYSLPFKDVEPTRWSYLAIAKLYYYGVVEGYNKNFFRPTDTVTVSSFADILNRIEILKYPMTAYNYSVILEPR